MKKLQSLLRILPQSVFILQPAAVVVPPLTPLFGGSLHWEHARPCFAIYRGIADLNARGSPAQVVDAASEALESNVISRGMVCGVYSGHI